MVDFILQSMDEAFPHDHMYSHNQYGIVTPHPNDVLSGRGNFVNYHEGNKRFRNIVNKYKEEYVACPKSDKPNFAKLVVNHIHSLDPPGRFLKQDSTSKLWYDIGKKKSLEKTRQALREGAPKIMKELTQEKRRPPKMKSNDSPVTTKKSAQPYSNESENKLSDEFPPTFDSTFDDETIEYAASAKSFDEIVLLRNQYSRSSANWTISESSKLSYDPKKYFASSNISYNGDGDLSPEIAFCEEESNELKPITADIRRQKFTETKREPSMKNDPNYQYLLRTALATDIDFSGTTDSGNSSLFPDS